MSVFGLDYETAGSVDLPKHGLYNYINGKDFRPLLACVYTEGKQQVFDFVFDPQAAIKLEEFLYDYSLGFAHNAPFERAVNSRINLDYRGKLYDSAVIARCMGAGSKLEAAGPQLLNTNKMDEGKNLIKKFSLPREDGTFLVDDLASWTDIDRFDWGTFTSYCMNDALISYRIGKDYNAFIRDPEWNFESVTAKMNNRGWYVDMDLVQRMQEQRDLERYMLQESFVSRFGDLNFQSTPQLRAWCKAHGLRNANSQSFDELSLIKLEKRIRRQLDRLSQDADPILLENLNALLEMITTKQLLGGSSLSKLEKITDALGSDGRIHDQYLHCGAGQTYRTSGRDVQMQNLKRLGPVVDDVSDVSHWNTARLASNLRQCFMAENPAGMIIVGDFSSVESRGLAYLAGEQWKLDAYAEGKDMYKVLASKMLGIPYENITKDQRRTGKVGELACGYQSGAGAVARFAEKMSVQMTEDEASQVVADWRATNPQIVELWHLLDEMLRHVLLRVSNQVRALGNDLMLHLDIIETPFSLQSQFPKAQSIEMILRKDSRVVLRRVFQGCEIKQLPDQFGRVRDTVVYCKPNVRKTGDLWIRDGFDDGKHWYYTLYGGKLTGILTQSFCRELFMQRMSIIDSRLSDYSNAFIVGQFHDEIAVEWTPDPFGRQAISLEHLVKLMKEQLSTTDYVFPNFPLTAEVSYAHRYIK